MISMFPQLELALMACTSLLLARVMYIEPFGICVKRCMDLESHPVLCIIGDPDLNPDED